MHHRLFYFSQSMGETAVFYSLSCKELGFDRVQYAQLSGPPADRRNATELLSDQKYIVKSTFQDPAFCFQPNLLYLSEKPQPKDTA